MGSNILQQSVLNKSRVDKFKLVFQLPPALRKINEVDTRSNVNVNEDSVQFSVYGTLVPRVTVPAVEIRYAGSSLYNSSHSKTSSPPVTVNFNIDNGYSNYFTLFKWLNLLHDQETGLFDKEELAKDDRFNEYQTDLTIYGLDEFNNPVISFTYTKAFPTDLLDIVYNYQDSEEITSGFTFVFSQLHIKLVE